MCMLERAESPEIRSSGCSKQLTSAGLACRYAIHGESSDGGGSGGVEENPGLSWAKDRQQRGVLPGQEVGQHIICCNAQATLKGAHRLSSIFANWDSLIALPTDLTN